jgi:hypothetical protein
MSNYPPAIDPDLLAIAAAQAARGEPVPTDEPLSQLQIDILELEDASFNNPGEKPGAKLSEFKRRHSTITEVGYGLALLRLLNDPRAYEHDNRRYAATLARIRRLHAEAEQYRTSLRSAS